MQEVSHLPKPLLPLGDRAGLEIAVEAFRARGFRSFHFLVGDDGHHIERFVADRLPQLDRCFHRVAVARGTAHSLHALRDMLPSCPMVVVYGDTVFSAEDLARCGFDESFVATHRVAEPRPYAYVRVEGSMITAAVEKPNQPPSQEAIAGLFYFRDSAELWQATERNFEQCKQANGEWSLTDSIDTMVRELGVLIRAVSLPDLIHLGTPEDYRRAIDRTR